MKRHHLLKLAALCVMCSSDRARSEPAALPSVSATQPWGAMVGFAPNLGLLKVPAGTLIDESNVDRVGALLAPGLELLVRRYALRLRITAYRPYAPSQGYADATRANLGKSFAWEAGQDVHKRAWAGYLGGLPFPQPQDGLEVAYNLLHRYVGDDIERYYDMSMTSAEHGVEYSECWRWLSMRVAHRTDLAPKPALPEFTREGYRSASLSTAFKCERHCLATLSFSSLDPVEARRLVFVPAQRRVLRGGTGKEPWNFTNYLADDVGGYDGAVEWMHWKIVARTTMLLPVDAGAPYGDAPKAVFELDRWPHWNPKVSWQPRPVFVLEMTPKSLDYPYRRVLMLVDAESYAVPYKETFDSKNELWKIFLEGSNRGPDSSTKPAFGLALDLLARHATLLSYRKVNVNSGLPVKHFVLGCSRRDPPPSATNPCLGTP